jgi:hypothetical protein
MHFFLKLVVSNFQKCIIQKFSMIINFSTSLIVKLGLTFNKSDININIVDSK